MYSGPLIISSSGSELVTLDPDPDTFTWAWTSVDSVVLITCRLLLAYLT